MEEEKGRDWGKIARAVGTMGGKITFNKKLGELYLVSGEKAKKRTTREIYFGGGKDGLSKLRDLTNPAKMKKPKRKKEHPWLKKGKK